MARKWVRRSGKPAPAFVSLDGTPSNGVACSLTFLRTFWRRIWQREVSPVDANRAWSDEHARQRNAVPRLGWQPLTAAELQEQARASNGKAAGADGWSGDEIRHWTLPIWQAYADLWNRWIDHRCYPTEWRYYLQVHLPKQDPHPVFGLDVGDARPLVLEPILCRIASSAWARRTTTRAWQQNWAPPGAHGGFQQRGVAVHALQNAYVRCFGILSLDYAKCFDRAHPSTATHALSQLGMPAEMVDLCRFQWSQQHRWLGLQGCICAEAEVVSSSLPQGDAISPMALNAILWAPIQAFSREEPTATAVTYLDDRNIAVRNHAQLDRTLQFWMRWAGMLGLEENVSKQKFLPRGSAAAQEVSQSGVVAVVHTLRILGVDFRTRINGKDRPTYQNRLREARARLGRIGCLPVTFTAKCQFIRQLVIPVAVWGTWFVYGAARTWKQLQQRLFGVLYGGKSPASLDLRALMHGHSLDFQFMADYQTISMRAKLVQLGRARWQPNAMCGTWQYAVATRLKFLGWQQQRNGSWTHQAVPRQCIRWTQNLQLDRLKHLLREAWRFRRFDAWRTSGRLDAVAAGNPIFQPARLKQASQLWSATCAHGRAVLTAAVVSPARLQSQLTGHAELWCPFCRECYAPTWDHCAWSCAHFRASRPNLPADSMQRRIGWPLPARTKIQNLRVLDHLASVRQALVDYRCM